MGSSLAIIGAGGIARYHSQGFRSAGPRSAASPTSTPRRRPARPGPSTCRATRPWGACARSKAYCEDRHAWLATYGLRCWAISHHLAGQLVSDPIDARHYAFAPAAFRGSPVKTKAWAVKTMKQTAKAAANMGLKVVNGFTGSPIWHLQYSFPPCLPNQIEK